MAGSSKNDDGMITSINITPMVDIMLVLLIIFMVTANIIVTPNIPVKLPSAATGEPTETKTLSIVITKDNRYFIEGKEINLKDMTAYITDKKEELKDKKKLQLVIAADREAYHGKVMKIVDIIRKLGITDYAFNIEEE